jgi:hypothetical protein
MSETTEASVSSETAPDGARPLYEKKEDGKLFPTVVSKDQPGSFDSVR